MPKKANKSDNKNSVVLMFSILGAVVFMLAMIIVWKFFM